VSWLNQHWPSLRGDDSRTLRQVFQSLTDWSKDVDRHVFLSHGSSGSAKTIRLNDATHHVVALNSNCTFTFTTEEPWSARAGYFALLQDGTGGRTVTWPSNVNWASGSPPILSSGALDFDIFEWIQFNNDNFYFRIYGLNFS